MSNRSGLGFGLDFVDARFWFCHGADATALAYNQNRKRQATRLIVKVIDGIVRQIKKIYLLLMKANVFL